MSGVPLQPSIAVLAVGFDGFCDERLVVGVGGGLGVLVESEGEGEDAQGDVEAWLKGIISKGVLFL